MATHTQESLLHALTEQRDTTTVPTLRKNPAGAGWVVQKFGGTSVGKFVNNIATTVVPSYLDQGRRVAVVCSARSGASKSTGTTNLLLRAASQALASQHHDDTSSTPCTPPSQVDVRNGRASRPQSPPTNLASLQHSLTHVKERKVSSKRDSGSHTPNLLRSLSLVKVVDEAYSSADQRTFEHSLNQIKSEHLEAAKNCIQDVDLLAILENDILADCDRIRNLLLAAQILDEISPRSKDIIVGMGERLACRIVAATLQDKGIDSELVILDTIVEKSMEENSDEIKTWTSQSGQVQLTQHFYDQLAKKLGRRLELCHDRIPVVTGFFGIVPGSLLGQIGRGYTDLCAALCAVGLEALELQVWKEVDGIFTADPRKVPTARLLTVVTPDEAAELTYYGSEVIHPFTMDQVIRASIPIRIKNVMSPSGCGTVIYPDTNGSSSSSSPGSTSPRYHSRSSTNNSNGIDTPSSAFMHVNGYIGPASNRSRKLPTAVTIKDDIIVLNIHSNRKTISHGFFARIFTTLDTFGIVVDLISTSEVHVSMALHSGMGRGVLEQLVRELKHQGEVEVLKDMAILSLVGKSMKNMVGIAGKLFSTLANGNVNIEMISQGASEINISCVIAECDATKALNIVHHNLLSLAPSLASVTHTGPWLF